MNTKIIVILIIGFAAGWLVNGWRLSSSYQVEKAEVVQANADHFADVSRKVNDRANEYLGNSEQLKKQIAELKKELAHAKKNHPVPADCSPDSDRLRVIKDAVHTANSTAAGQSLGC